MLGTTLGLDKRHYEYVFSGATVSTYAEQTSVEDWRKVGDKVLFRKLQPAGPAWTNGPDGAEFAAGAGALGVGALWTRPVRLDAGLGVESVHLQVQERRALDGGAGGMTLVAHVRDRAVVGEAKDVDSTTFVLHGNDDAADEAWHGHVFDLMAFLQPHLTGERYVTFEIRVESLKAARAPRAVVIGLKPVVLTFVGTSKMPTPRS